MNKITTDEQNEQTPEIQQPLDELARMGARRMIKLALELEVEEYIQELKGLLDEEGHAIVVRNGKSHHERTVNLGAGPVSFQTPRVNDRRPDHRFTSKILPPYMRRSPRLEEALPVLYLRGLSTGDFTGALKA
ncbi:MAG: transposase, partial [Anaerolineales bacterium]